MNQHDGMAIAGYGLAFALLGKMLGKRLLTKREAEELIDSGILYLEELGSGDSAVLAACKILEQALQTVRESKSGSKSP